MTHKQERAANLAWQKYELSCQEVHLDRNKHEGVAAFMIAKALIKITPGLSYRAAEQWALDWIASRP